MNERIKELEKQAYDTVDFEYAPSKEFFNKAKFAELIVKECAKEAAYWWPADYYGAETVEDRILQHFGVEE